MVTNTHFSKTLRFLIGAASLGVAIWTMRTYASLLNSVFLAIIIVVCAVPVLYWLQRKGTPGMLAFLITLVVVVAVGVAFVLLIVGSITRLADALPTYLMQAEATKATLANRLASLGLETSDLQRMLSLLDPERLFDAIANFLGGLVAALSDLVVVVMVVVFLLLEALSLPAKVKRQVKLGNTRLVRMSEFSYDLRQYVVITTIIGAVTGLGNTVFLLILGVDFAVLWGVLAFVLSYIPTIGFWLALIPPTLLALLEFGVTKALIVFVGYVLINGFAENVVKPKYMGEGLDLAPVMIVLSLIFWAAVLGPLGAILGVPLTMTVKELILAADEENRWLAELMGAGDDTAPAGEQEANAVGGNVEQET
jgi:predicted PurR-regulated permease PerM